MNFGELLGAGLLGGVGNAAKGAGDRLREEAKQKREMALLNEQQANALEIQEAVAEDNIDLATAKGEITKGVNDAGSLNNLAEIEATGEVESGLLAQKGDIASAAAVVEQANNITNLDKKGDIAKDLAKLQSELNKGENADKATLDQLRVKLEGSIAAKAASQLATTNATTAAVKATTDADAAAVQVTTDADTAAAAAVVAADAAEALAGTQMKQLVYKAGVNSDVANQLAITQAAQAEKLGATRMAEINANNVAALAQINAGKIGDVHSFYDETTGMEYKAVRNKDGGWDLQGGTKASTASKNAYTLQDIQIEGVNVRGYMNGTDFVVVGNPIPDSNKTDWDEKQVTDYATAQGWKRVGVAVNIWGRPIGKDISADDKAKVTKWTADVVTQWNKTGTSPATLVNDILGGKKTGSPNEAKDLSDGQRAIDAGNRTLKQVVDALKKKYPKIDTSGLTAKK